MQYSKRYDVYGEHVVTVEDNKMTDIGDGLELEPETTTDLHDPFMFLWSVAKDLDKRGRKIPLTEKEVEAIIKSKPLRKLQAGGYVVKRVLAMHTKESGKANVGSRACICFTDKGRRYARSREDEKVQRDSSGTGSDSVRSVGGHEQSSDSASI